MPKPSARFKWKQGTSDVMLVVTEVKIPVGMTAADLDNALLALAPDATAFIKQTRVDFVRRKDSPT